MTLTGEQASATAAGIAVEMRSLVALDARPPNATGFLVEFRGNAPSIGPLNRWHVDAVSKGEKIASTEDPDSSDTYTIRIEADQYRSGQLRVNYYPAEGSATTSRDIVIQVTTFFGEPDWEWSAFTDSS